MNNLDEVDRNTLRIADIQTSLAVMANAMDSTNKRIDGLLDSFERHMAREEASFDKLIERLESKSKEDEVRLRSIEARLNEAEGIVKGGRWVLGICFAILAFLGIKIGIT
jgi:vacuolar-type H+-ATPase subunit D/Vma8